MPGGLDDNPDKELCRYEFFEIIVRMALAKYPNMQPPEALSKRYLMILQMQYFTSTFYVIHRLCHGLNLDRNLFGL